MAGQTGETPQGEILIYQDGEGDTRIEVRLEDETVWLSQQQMADLFQTTKSNINEHIKHIFEEGELEEMATVRNFRTVRQEGSRKVEREIAYYNLDMIISLGYRVRSLIATQFRRWATIGQPAPAPAPRQPQSPRLAYLSALRKLRYMAQTLSGIASQRVREELARQWVKKFTDPESGELPRLLGYILAFSDGQANAALGKAELADICSLRPFLRAIFMDYGRLGAPGRQGA